jgi:hypothetical protein
MKRTIIVFLFILSLVYGAAAAERPIGMKEYTSVDELANEIASYFPAVQGEVKAVADDRLTVTLGARDGLQKGVVLSVWRDGSEILHPVTKIVIGRIEEEVGILEVTEVGETTSTGVIKKKLKEPRAGDKARITPKKLGLALVPIRADHPEIVQGLAVRLKENGRFTVLDSEKGAAFLSDKKQHDAAMIKEMGKTFALDVVTTIEIHPSDGKYLVTVGIYYSDDARPLDTIVAMLDLSTKRDALGEIEPFFSPFGKGKSDTEDLPFDAELFSAADLEGTGSLQYIFSDGARIHIFKLGTSGWKEMWAQSIDYTSSEMQHLNLDTADINNNGKPEIFVTGMLNGKVVSIVIEFRDGFYQQIADVPGFLRVVTSFRKGSILVGQAYDPVSFFTGLPQQYAWLDGNYVPYADFALPEGVGLYGFAYVEAGETNPLLVVFDKKDRLLVYSNRAVIWKSEEKYPAVRKSVIKPVTGIDLVFSPSPAETDKARMVKISGRIFTIDLNGDGREDILLPKNSGGTFLTRHNKAEFFGLGWTGTRLEQRWNIPKIPGVVLDYHMVRQQGSGAQILALVMDLGGIFSSDSVRVMTFATK